MLKRERERLRSASMSTEKRNERNQRRREVAMSNENRKDRRKSKRSENKMSGEQKRDERNRKRREQYHLKNMKGSQTNNKLSAEPDEGTSTMELDKDNDCLCRNDTYQPNINIGVHNSTGPIQFPDKCLDGTQGEQCMLNCEDKKEIGDVATNVIPSPSPDVASQNAQSWLIFPLPISSYYPLFNGVIEDVSIIESILWQATHSACVVGSLCLTRFKVLSVGPKRVWYTWSHYFSESFWLQNTRL